MYFRTILNSKSTLSTILLNTFQKPNVKLLIMVATILQLFDAIVTYIFVNNGQACEGNIFQVLLLKNGLFLPERLLSVLLFIFLISILSKFSKKLASPCSVVVIILYSWVLASNYIILNSV